MAEKPTYNNDVGLPDTHYNPLQNYRNVTYNTRLTMMPSGESTKSRRERSYDFKKGITVWETGGTGTVFLEELTIETVGTGNETANYAMQDFHKFQGKLIEPIGGRLIEAISLSAMALDYPNNSDAVYLLEVYFTGYDNSDMPVTCKGWDDEELVFRWYVKLLQLKMSLNYQGSTYDFEMYPDLGNAKLSDFTNLEQGFRMEGHPDSIGSFCSQLQEALNKREKDKVDSGLRCYPHKYKISAHKDITNFKFDYGFFSNLAHLWGLYKGEIQVNTGTSIQTFILGSMTNSKELLKFLHRIPERKEFNATDTKPDTIHMPMKNISIISGSKAQEQGGKVIFDNKLGSVAYEVHYFITTKEDAKNIISPQEYKDAQDQGNRDKRVDNWIKKGLLRKVYKWIYTGENTEVISADIKIDNLWRNVRPLWIDENGNPIAASSTPKPAQKGQAGKATSKAINCNEARQVEKLGDGQTQYYAEDIPFKKGDERRITAKPGWWPHMPRYYHMNTTVDQASQQSSVYQESAQEYSIFRQIGNNQATGGSDMFSLNLETVGDPYWLFQIPGKPGTPPWEEDVWEYEKEQLTEEQLAEKRKKTASHNWLPFIWFEAVVPSVDWTSTDLMSLKNADAVTGIYAIKKVVNKFVKGKFTSQLECFRDALSNPWSKKAGPAGNKEAVGGGTGAGKGPSNAGPFPSANASNTRASQDYPANPSNNVPPRPTDSKDWKGQQVWDSKYASGWNADGTSKKR